MLQRLTVWFVLCLTAHLWADNASQSFLDSHQYSVTGIQRYECIFGKDFVSAGGLETTQEFVALLNLKAGERVLDVGSGTGGSAFYMAREFGVFVEGVDISLNMVAQARKRADEMHLPVVFTPVDVMQLEYPPASFDVIYSRDTLLHIAQKKELFQKFRRWLKPEGRLLITDYCISEAPVTQEFQAYLEDRQYQLLTVPKYEQMLRDTGFEQVRAENRTEQFIRLLSGELQKFENEKPTFLQQFSEQDYQDITNGWQAKVNRCSQGLQQWGLFLGVNPG